MIKQEKNQSTDMSRVDSMSMDINRELFLCLWISMESWFYIYGYHWRVNSKDGWYFIVGPQLRSFLEDFVKQMFFRVICSIGHYLNNFDDRNILNRYLELSLGCLELPPCNVINRGFDGVFGQSFYTLKNNHHSSYNTY